MKVGIFLTCQYRRERHDRNLEPVRDDPAGARSQVDAVATGQHYLSGGASGQLIPFWRASH
jgi:hypothetical protein